VRQPLSTLYLLQAAGFLLPQTPLREKIDDAANKDTKISTLQALFFKYEEKF